MAVPEKGTLPTQQQPEFIAVDEQNNQVRNNANGFVYQVDDKTRLKRYLIIGCQDSTFYTNKENLELENLTCLQRLINDGKGVEAVRLISEISRNRRNVKSESLLLAYALCIRCNDQETKRAAYEELTTICRTPTHLFLLVEFCEKLSLENHSTTGWGRAHKRAVSKWYTQFASNPNKLIHLVAKYKCRMKWSHIDVIRLAHTCCRTSTEIAFILRYIVKDLGSAKEHYNENLKNSESLREIANIIQDYEEAIKCPESRRDNLCHTIRIRKLTWEQCPSRLLRYRQVWLALLPHMPIEALLRNLGRMSNLGLFGNSREDEAAVDMVVTKLRDVNAFRNNSLIEDDARINVVHPFRILVAYDTYSTGCGRKGKLQWSPNELIQRAVDAAFYNACQAFIPTNQKFLLAVNIQGSMTETVLKSSSIDCATAAAVMMMVTARTEPNTIIKCFHHKVMEDITIQADDTLQTVLNTINRSSMHRGADNPRVGVDCALPMKYAIEQKIHDIDVFVIYTDSETWSGNVHVCEAIREYREYANRTASKPRRVKLIVCGMTCTKYTLKDPIDPDMLNVIGFDSNTPSIISEFVQLND